MLGFIFKNNKSKVELKEPNVFDLFGDMPEDSFFHTLALVVQKKMEESATQIKVDWSKSFPTKPLQPNYSGLVAIYSYQLALEINEDLIAMMLNLSSSLKYGDDERVDRLASNYVFYYFCGLRIGQMLDLNLIDEFINQHKLDLIKQFFFDKSELGTLGVDMAKKGEIFFLRLANDERESTKNFLEEIGKFFVASIVSRADHNTELISKINEYGRKLYFEFERSILSS
jgi:hypothetical protein